MKNPPNPKVRRYLLRYSPRKGLILDAGCGYFTHANFLRSYANNIICVDVSNYDRDEALKNNFLLATVESLPFKDDSFDFFYSLSVLQFIKDDAGVINKFHRILKPEGRLLLTVPTGRSIFRLLRDLEIWFGVYRYPQFNVAGHHYYSRGSIRKLTSGKFKLIEIRGCDFNFLPRLHTFLVAVLKSNGVIRRVWKSLPKKSNNPSGVTLMPANVATEACVKPSRFGNLLKSFLSRLKLVSDFGYHYIVVLEKI